MTDLQGVELLVQLDPLCEPISGRVTDGRGQHQTFAGWLDLMDILDRARHRHEVEPNDDTKQQSGGTK
jgi:hypothetical protein